MTHTATPPNVPVATPRGAAVVPKAVKGPVLLAIHATPSPAALDAARQFAARMDVPVQVLTVVEPIPTAQGGEGLAMVPAMTDERRIRELDSLVRPKLERAWGNSVNWQLNVVSGSPARVIAEEARRQGASLIVIGKGKHSTIDRLFGGQVTLRVAMLASTPVFAVAPNFEHAPRSATVAVDFSVSSFVAARAALSLLEPLPGKQSQLMMVHIRPPAPLGLNEWTENYDRVVSGRLTRFAGLLGMEQRKDIQATTHLLDGDAVDALLEAASESGSDIIAVGTRGPGWWERTFIGSTATGILRRATRSVLIAPPPPPAERIRLELLLDGHATLERSSDWEEALGAFTGRNRGRRVRLEITHTALGLPAVQAQDLCFRGASYDPRAGRLGLMLSDETQLMEHLTHNVSNVRAVDMVAGADGRDRALLVEDASGHAVLTFRD